MITRLKIDFYLDFHRSQILIIYPSCQNKIPPPEPLFQKPRLRKNFTLKREVRRTELPEKCLTYFRCVYNDFYIFYVNEILMSWYKYYCKLSVWKYSGRRSPKKVSPYPVYVCIFYIFYNLAYFLCNIFVWKSSVWISMNISIINGIY